MSFDPETIQSLFFDPNETEYSEDFRERSGSSAVFDHALKLQMDFFDTTLKESELVDAWNGAQDKLGQLESEASEQGVLGLPVRLVGSGIAIPKFETDLVHGVSMTTLQDVTSIDEQSVEKYYNADDVKGVFSGFTLLFDKAEEETYIPRIAYQVAVKVVDVPHMHVNLYATGKVGQTLMRFESDEQLDALAPILEKLYGLTGDAFEKVNLINMTLAKFEKYDASHLRHIAYHAEMLINGVDETDASSVEDALIELITHYIGSGENIHLKTPFFALSPIERGGDTQYYENEEPYNVAGECLGLGFFNRVAIKDGTVTIRKGRGLHIVMSHEGRNLVSPMARIEEYSIV